MTSSLKERLVDALKTSVKYFNEDNDPDKAVIKAAKDFNFNVDQTTRLIEMFNTARTIYHYKTASDRTQPFRLADPDRIILGLFESDNKDKKASNEYVDAISSYFEYDKKENDYTSFIEKAAEVDVKPKEQDIEVDAAIQRVIKEIRSLRKIADFVYEDARIADYNASAALSKLAHLFSCGDTKEAMEDKYSRLVAIYKNNPEWSPVVNLMIDYTPKKDRASDEKIAEAEKQAVIDDSDLSVHIELLKEAKEALEAHAILSAVSEEFRKEANEAEIELAEIVGLSKTAENWDDILNNNFIKSAKKVTHVKKKEIINPVSGSISTIEEESSAGQPESNLELLVNRINRTTGEIVDNLVGQTYDLKTIERSFLNKIKRENKQLSKTLKNVQRQILLQDLLVNDPVLSKEDPDAVVNAYEALLQIAPEVSTNKEITRAILRQTIHSTAISPYDAEVWTKLEQNINNIRKGIPVKRDKDSLMGSV